MHWILWLGVVPLVFGLNLVWRWTVRDFSVWSQLRPAYRRTLPLRLLAAAVMILVGLYMTYEAVMFLGGERNVSVSEGNYIAEGKLQTPPPTPPISSPGKVIDWFLQYDSKISDYGRNYPEGLTDLKADILADLASSSDSTSLKARLDSLIVQYDEVLPQAAARYEGGGPIGGESHEEYTRIMHEEAYVAAKIRILRYFLQEKYGIQLE